MAVCTLAEVKVLLEASTGVTVPAVGDTYITAAIPRATATLENFIRWRIEQASYVDLYPDVVPNNYFDGDVLNPGFDLTTGGAVVPRQRGDRSKSILMVRNIPLRSVTEVRENVGAWNTAGGTWPDSSIIAATDYYADYLDYAQSISWSGIIYRNSGIWTVQPRAIKVSYTAGLTAGELSGSYADVKSAVIETVATWYMQATQISKSGAAGGPVAALRIRDFNVSYINAANNNAQMMDVFGFDLPASVKMKMAKYIHIGGLM